MHAEGSRLVACGFIVILKMNLEKKHVHKKIEGGLQAGL